MYRYKTLIGAIAILVISLVALSACSQSGASGPTVKATWLTPQIAGETVSIPLSEVKKDSIVHFKVSNPTIDLAFMAYEYDGQLYARANICPPCRSESFSLSGNTLVCDTCGTVFDARTGAGIKGACVAYPKASVAYQLQDGNVVMQGDELITAFRNTLTPKKS